MFNCCDSQCGVLGLVDLKANRERFKKKKENTKENHENMQKHLPKVKLKDGQQENVLWIPPYLIFSVITANMIMKGHDIDGPNFEQDTVYSFHSVFDKFGTGSRNVTVLAGWKHTWRNDGSKGGIGEDHDLVIIDGNRHIVINFEIKYTISKTGLFQKALDQLYNQQKYFEEFHHELQLGGWSFINVLVYKDNVDVKLCPDCEFFTLNKEKMKPENLKIWWDKLGDKISPDTNTTRMAYEEVVERFVGPCTKVPDFLCNERQIRDREHKTLTGSNDIVGAGILTGTLKDSKQMKTNAEAAKNQLTYEEQLLLDESNRVILTGDYGTGKTHHLVEKVRKLAKKKEEKVVILVGNIRSLHFDRLLYEDLKGAVVLHNYLVKEFEKLENVKIIHLGEVFHKFFNSFKMLKKYLKQGYHLFFDEFFNIPSQYCVGINDVVALSSKYPGQTMWIAMRSDNSHLKAPGFDVIHLKVNFRNSPKIIQGVNDFFEAMALIPDSQRTCANSVFVSVNQKRLDEGSPKLSIEHSCGLQNQSLGLIRTALETYKGENVVLVEMKDLHSEYKSRLSQKELLEQEVPEFSFVPLWEYTKDALNTCFFYFTSREKYLHDIWNGIEVKNLIVYVGCSLHSIVSSDSNSDSDSVSIFIEILRSLMLRASVSLTVIICPEQGCSQHRFWQHRMKQCFTIVKPKDIFPEMYDSLMKSFQQLLENPIKGAIAVPHTNNILVWDAVIFGLDNTPFEGGIFELSIEFYENFKYRPPLVKFHLNVYHPNINKNGEMWMANVEIEERCNAYTVLKTVKSLLRTPDLRVEFLANGLAAWYYGDSPSEYEERVRACFEHSSGGNLSLNQVKAEWKAKQEDFLRKLKEEERNK
jgi:ubiquitin-conjugating enzyme E2 A